ncbi:MAG: glycosyl transferase family 2 [Clostridia bacterium]|nr:glycosyl transferase family 2 [Clostridia bacterium]
MNQLKVAVYAICKNEKNHLRRWMSSMQEADGIFVLDTGSCDGSPELLRSLGAEVSCMTISPWRFDSARNASLELVPEDYDVCVCCDLDEFFAPGWRKCIEKSWTEGVTRLSYPFYYDHNGSFFMRGLIHARHGYRWQWPVHEALVRLDPGEVTASCRDIALYHDPDPEKSRSSYLPMLEKAVEADPLDARMLHYLGREYMYRGMYQRALDTLTLHAAIGKWDAERCASLRYAGRCLEALGRRNEALIIYRGAVDACPRLREPYIEYALCRLQHGDLEDCISLCQKALSIIPDGSYFCESFASDDFIIALLQKAEKKAALLHAGEKQPL